MLYLWVSTAGAPRVPFGTDITEVIFVDPPTEQKQLKQISMFTDWLALAGISASLLQLLECPTALGALLRQFGVDSYRKGSSRYYFALLVTGLGRLHPILKGVPLAPCWDILHAWDWLQPVKHRPPLPKALYRAMIAVALCLGWIRWAGCLMIAFFGITRIGEVLKAARQHLVLPCDTLDDDSLRVLLEIPDPKSKRFGERVQHTRITQEAEVSFIIKVFGSLSPEERLFPGSQSAFRSRWDRILLKLDIPKTLKFTPACVRGGGCVAAFESGLAITDLMWLMRVRNQETLSHYLQEVAAATHLKFLSASSKDAVKTASKMYRPLLTMAERPQEPLLSPLDYKQLMDT
jgi:hypothetical protein